MHYGGVGEGPLGIWFLFQFLHHHTVKEVFHFQMVLDGNNSMIGSDSIIEVKIDFNDVFSVPAIGNKVFPIYAPIENHDAFLSEFGDQSQGECKEANGDQGQTGAYPYRSNR